MRATLRRVKIIFVGDVVGATGRSVIEALLPGLVETEQPDFVVINGTEPAWVFRWCDDAYRDNFVGDTEACPASRLLEVVAEVHLSTKLSLRAGDPVSLHFK